MQFFDVWVRNAAPGMYEPGLNVSAAKETFLGSVQVELMRDRFVCRRADLARHWRRFQSGNKYKCDYC